VFVTFEGGDGSGKTTQTALLQRSLAADGHDVVATREPGGTPLGERVRKLLLGGDSISPWAEAALFAAARAELVELVIRPALERGADVVCDRYVDSSLAYQGIARGLGVDAVLKLNLTAVQGLLPDRTFVLLLSPEEALRRRGTPGDRLEHEGRALADRVDSAYRQLVERFPGRLVPVDASQPPDVVASLVREEIGIRA
jgi:dTMP kinase